MLDPFSSNRINKWIHAMDYVSLHRVVDDWLENINDGELRGVCLLDISWTNFDSINHDTMVSWFIESKYVISRTWKCTDYKISNLSGLKDIFTTANNFFRFWISTYKMAYRKAQCLFLLFNNDISKFSFEGCILNMFADDVIIWICW